MKWKFLLLSLLLPFTLQASWDLNDVSYLFPLPKDLKTSPLLKLQTQGKGGKLLDPKYLSQMPALALAFTKDEMAQALQVVAVRIDPCFPLPTPMNCQKQIRLIWQPLEIGRKGEVQTVDAALHSFYSLTDSEFASVLQEIQQWKEKYQTQTAGLPLQIHPAFVFGDHKEESLVEFQNILIKYVGSQNLFRVTAMVLRGAGNMWAFANFEFNANGELKMQPIARLNGKTSQTFINLAVPADHFEGGGIFPKPQGSDVINDLFSELTRQPPIHEDVLRQQFEALFRIENPKNFSPENMDCVSCHVTQVAKHFFFANRADLQLDQIGMKFGYQNSKYNLENKSADLKDTQIIRGFGYFGQGAAISQRVINESAEVADLLNQSSR